MKRLTYKDICEYSLNITDKQDMLNFFNGKLCYGKFSIFNYNNCDDLFSRTIRSEGAAQHTLLMISNGTLGEFFEKFDFQKCREALSDIEVNKLEELEKLESDMIGFNNGKNDFIDTVIKKAFTRDKYDGLMLCLLVSLYPCDYLDDNGQTIQLRTEEDHSDYLVRLIKKYRRLLADEKFENTHSSIPIIAAFRKESERINRNAKTVCGRFIPLSLSEQYPKIREMTLKSFCNFNSQDSTQDSTLEEILKNNPNENIMIRGEGGCGKTFSLINLAESLFDDEESNVIPVYVQLNDYKTSHRSLLEYVYTILFDCEGAATKHENPQEAMNEWFRKENNEQLLLLLDGFNEIPSKSLQIELSQYVRRLIDNPKIRFIITSRYNMESYFTSELNSFKEYWANKLSCDDVSEYIERFFAGNIHCDKFLSDAMVPGTRNCVKDFLQTPMALIMYCLVNLPELSDNPMRSFEDDCQTYGELMQKYIQRIKDSYELRGVEIGSLNNAEKMLWCAGFYMNVRRTFNFLPADFEHFIFDAGFHILYNGFGELTTHIFFRDMTKCEPDGSIEFIHQNYRDFFAACFLMEIFVHHDVNEINKYFGNNIIPQEVMALLADIFREYKCRDRAYDSAVQMQFRRADKDNLSPSAISQIIRIAARGREGDLSLFDFSGLNLSDTSLNGIKLYQDNNTYAKFDEAVVKKFTLNALGQPGAVFSMLWILNRFLLSFSKMGFFCFDMKIGKNYQITDYPEYAVRAALCLNEQFILTGDDSGKITLWKYKAECDVFHIAKMSSMDLHTKCAKIVGSVRDIVKFFGKIYVSTDCGVCRFCADGDLSKTSCKEIIVSTKDSKPQPCKLTVNGRNLYCSFGKTVKKISNDGIVANYYEFESGSIIDVAAVDFGFGEVILTNIQDIDTDGKRFSKVIAVKNHNEYLVASKLHDGRTGFKGWKSFSEMYNNNTYLAADIEDAPDMPGLLKISCFGITEFQGADYYGNHHSMSVNCAVCFNFNNRDYIATGSTERSVEILETQFDGGTLLEHLDGHDNGIHYIDVVNDKEIYAAHYSGEVSKWFDSGNGWRCVQVWAPHTFWVWECRYINVDGTGYIVSCSYDKTISVINERTGDIIKITEPISRVLSFGFLSDDTILIGYNDEQRKTLLRTFKIDYAESSYTALPESKALGEIGYDLRSIHTITSNGQNRLLLCANTNNTQGAVFEISAEQDQPYLIREICEEKKNVIIRYIDEIIFSDKTIVTCGGDYSDELVDNAFYVTVFDNNEERITVFAENENGCSALRLVEYNSSLYFISGNYGGKICIYIIDLKKRKAKPVYTYERLNDKVLNIQYCKDTVFFSTLNGKVYSFSFEKAILENNVEPEMIFQSISGVRCCYVDFTNINRENSELTGEFGEIIGRYGKVE